MTTPLSIARSRRGVALLIAALIAACDQAAPAARTPKRDAGAPLVKPVAKAPRANASARPLAETPPRDAGSKGPPSREERQVSGATAWIFDRPVDVGPAGPASASEQGVVFVTSSDDIVLAALTKPNRNTAARAAAAPVKAIAEETRFRHSTRPPLVLGQNAYWVSAGRLLRRSLAGGAPLEVLRTDARTGTKLSGALLGSTPYVAYITQSGSGDPRARLWVEGQALVDLTPEGSSASSTSLLLQSTGRLLFVALEGRSAMSPVHVRSIRAHAGRPELEADRVLWVGGGAQATTELATVKDENGHVWVVVPLERSATEFGLASIPVRQDAVPDDAVSWTAYANGLERPALATGQLCGRAALLTGRPSAAAPGARQKLHLSTLEGGAVADRAVVLEAQRIRDVSLAAWDGGGVIASIADGRSLAVTVRCATPGKRF